MKDFGPIGPEAAARVCSMAAQIVEHWPSRKLFPSTNEEIAQQAVELAMLIHQEVARHVTTHSRSLNHPDQPLNFWETMTVRAHRGEGPVFSVVRMHDRHEFNIYRNGEVEGFDDGCVVINRLRHLELAAIQEAATHRGGQANG